MDAATVSQVLSFLDVDRLTANEGCQALPVRLAAQFDAYFHCFFECPRVRSRRTQSRMFLRFSSRDPNPIAMPVSGNDMQQIGRQKKGVYFTLRDSAPIRNIVKGVFVRWDKEFSDQQIRTIAAISEEYVARLVAAQRVVIRRELVDARARSGDLGSLLHRVLNDSTVLKAIGAEAGSLFIADPLSDVLLLRSTTGMRQSIPRSDIYFHKDEPTKVAQCYRSSTPRFEFNSRAPLQEGRSAERVGRGPWARAYWPIRLQLQSRLNPTRRSQRPIMGVVRVTNSDISSGRLPFSWINLSCLEFCAEGIYNVVVGYIESEEAAFKKDEAFHASASVVDSIRKNIHRVSRLLFEEASSAGDLLPIRRRYRLEKFGDFGHDEGEQVRRLLRTAYASAMDIGFQIERANMEVPIEEGDHTEELLTSVIFRALDMLPTMCVAYSVTEPQKITRFGELYKKRSIVTPVVGPAEALTSVFVNVFENAIKYRRYERPLRITVDIEDDGPFISVLVRDFGIGVDGQDVDKLLLRHFRSRRAREHTVRGTGLGLSWCADVLRKCGGQIRIEPMRVGLLVKIRLKKRIEATHAKSS